jgi:hypothetical protein
MDQSQIEHELETYEARLRQVRLEEIIELSTGTAATETSRR